MHAAALPDLEGLDVEVLKALLVAQHKIYAEEISRQNDSYTDEIGRLKLLIETLRHMLFGTKSEKLVRQIDQLELQLEDLQAARAINLPVAAEEQQPLASKPSRRALPEHLPREVHTHEPEHHLCPDCGGALRDLGEDASEVLE